MAALWYRKAAEQGNVKAQIELANIYTSGSGVPKDELLGIFWNRKAAEQGDAEAEDSLGTSYYLGIGVPRDFVQAVAWYRKAAEQGNADAQYNLGGCYENGEGVPQDYAEAYFWLDLSAAGTHSTKFFQDEARKLRDEAASNLTKTLLLQTQERVHKWFEDHPSKSQ